MRSIMVPAPWPMRLPLWFRRAGCGLEGLCGGAREAIPYYVCRCAPFQAARQVRAKTQRSRPEPVTRAEPARIKGGIVAPGRAARRSGAAVGAARGAGLV